LRICDLNQPGTEEEPVVEYCEPSSEPPASMKSPDFLSPAELSCQKILLNGNG